jgi:predicted nucleic acid-binding protein
VRPVGDAHRTVRFVRLQRQSHPAKPYRDVALVSRAARGRGLTVWKLLDCLIAAVAARTGATLVHRNFDVLADALPDLRVRSLV